MGVMGTRAVPQSYWVIGILSDRKPKADLINVAKVRYLNYLESIEFVL
jgi:hypothetical protein